MGQASELVANLQYKASPCLTQNKTGPARHGGGSSRLAKDTYGTLSENKHQTQTGPRWGSWIGKGRTNNFGMYFRTLKPYIPTSRWARIQFFPSSSGQPPLHYFLHLSRVAGQPPILNVSAASLFVWFFILEYIAQTGLQLESALLPQFYRC